MWSVGQVAMAPSAVPPTMAVEDLHQRSSLSAGSHTKLRLSSAGPQWKEITAAQRQVLMPLRERWNSMGALTKRRWLVLADRYPHMDAPEQTKLLTRMTTWASLSTQQRNQARLNFSTAKQLTAQELQAKWDEYQALSEAEKKRLAEQAIKTKATKKAKRRPVASQSAPKTPAPGATEPTPANPTAAPSNASMEAMQDPSSVVPIISNTDHSTAAEAPIASSQPITIPQAQPHVELLPLPSETTDASKVPGHSSHSPLEPIVLPESTAD